MRNLIVITLVVLSSALAFVSGGVSRSDAKTLHQPRAPLVYTLELVRVVDAPAQYVWMVNAPFNASFRLDGTAFRSLDSPALRDWVGSLPKGAIIDYTPSSTPFLGKVSGDPETSVGNFAKFCRSRSIQFGYNPTL